MKHLLYLLPLAALSAVSCTPSLPPVPPSNRTVVAPSGSSERMKAWSSTTKQEADSVLGPLSNTERR